jgi:hypothetical protein
MLLTSENAGFRLLTLGVSGNRSEGDASIPTRWGHLRRWEISGSQCEPDSVPPVLLDQMHRISQNDVTAFHHGDGTACYAIVMMGPSGRHQLAQSLRSRFGHFRAARTISCRRTASTYALSAPLVDSRPLRPPQATCLHDTANDCRIVGPKEVVSAVSAASRP